MEQQLRTSIIIDYQNIHLTGHDLFEQTAIPKHETLVHPLHFANQVVRARNHVQRPGYPLAKLARVLVYRGEPSPVHDPKAHARNMAQQLHWQQAGDPKVIVTMRPLKYAWEYDAYGRPATDHNGVRIWKSKSEKGVDVLCALALVREAQREDVDLVILASHDSDLGPALDEAIERGSSKVETMCWWDPQQRHRGYGVSPSKQHRKTVWNTRVNETAFNNCRDLTDYR